MWSKCGGHQSCSDELIIPNLEFHIWTYISDWRDGAVCLQIYFYQNLGIVFIVFIVLHCLHNSKHICDQ